MRDVVFVTAGRWPGTLVIVTETKPWGVQGYIPLPGHDDDGGDRVHRAFVRIPTENFIKVGEIPDEDPEG